MKRHRIILIAASLLLSAPSYAWEGTSPDGRLKMNVQSGRCTLTRAGRQVLQILVDSCASACPQDGKPKGTRISADYQMVAGKQLHCTNEANEYRTTAMTWRLYNDGLAFRYETPGTTERTAYMIAEGTRRWMQQWCDSYEGFFPLSTTCKVKPVRSFSGTFTSPEGWNNRWGYPALLQPADDVFVLLTEANIEHGQSASCLYNDGELFSVVPAARDDSGASGEHNAHTPWRVAIVGSLADVVASTLVTDVSEPSKIADTSWIRPGVVSWVYWAYNHGSNDYNIIKQYVDLAVSLKLPYVLIDAEWDQMKDGRTIDDAVDYAKQKGVKPMIWYNSSVGWVDGAPTPKYRLNKAEDREREFAWCERLGVAGVKIDFFSGDTQQNMDYCQELLACAARHHLLVNFHGATVPRGWQRTWPDLLSTEGVYGAEWYNNTGSFTDRAAAHNATLPFTRNVIGPMDYTPCAFSDSQHPHITTHAHELALTVVFESGLQHLADRPESFLAQPKEVQDFLGRLPAAWDETRLVSGYPADHAVMARRCGQTWYVAGINGRDEAQTLHLDLSFIPKKCWKNGLLFADSQGNDDRGPWSIGPTTKRLTELTLKPRGGFVIRLLYK